MTASDLFSFMYVLVCEEVGGRMVFEDAMKKYEDAKQLEEYAASPDRFAPDRQLPKPAADQMKAAMALGGMARPRGVPDDEEAVNAERQKAADALEDLIERNKEAG